jgi:predicted oxidoreductase
MNKVFINENGPEVSQAIYSFWRWTGEELTIPNAVKEMVHFTRELGITTYDLSPNFAHGEVERQLGQLIGSKELQRDELILSTKTGIYKLPENYGSTTYYDLSPNQLQRSVESSLNRLQTDYIDILILEHIDFLVDFEQTASALLKLQRAGKIRHIGVADLNVFQQRLLSSYLSQPIITNHLELNLLQSNSLHDGRLDFIKEQHSRPMAFSPLADGRILLGEDAPAVKLRLALSEIGKKYEANVEQTAVAWVHKLGALPIIGSKEKRRIQNAATAQSIHLSHEDWYYLYNATL